jgi:hypothetical protein
LILLNHKAHASLPVDNYVTCQQAKEHARYQSAPETLAALQQLGSVLLRSTVGRKFTMK